MKYLDAHQLRYLFLAGMLMGCASLFRWDIALYAGITAILVLCIVQSNEISKKNQKTGVYTHISSIFALSALLLAGALLVALPVYGYLASKTGFDNLWAQMIVFPTTQLHNYRWIPYPAVIPQRDEYGSLHLGEWLRFYLPAVTYALALLTVLYALLRKRAVFGIRQFGQVVIVVFGALLFVQALSRYDYIHVVPTSLVVFIVILTLLEDYLRSTRNAQIKYVLLVPVLVLFAVYFFPPIKRLATYVTEYSPLKCHSSLEKARCIYLSFDQQQAVQYIQRHTKQNETIFVGNQRHDLIFVNDISFYFLSDRVSATSYHELYPGVATTLSVQTMIVNEIETKNVDWLVLVDMGESNEPNASSTSSGVHYLDDHIRTKFSPLYRIDAYDIWRRANN